MLRELPRSLSSRLLALVSDTTLTAVSPNASSNTSQVPTSLEGIRTAVVGYLTDKLHQFIDWLAVNLPGIVLGIIIIIVGYRLSKTVSRYAGRPVYQWVNRPSLARTILRLIRYAIFGASILIALRIGFNVSFTSFVLTATVFSAVVGIILAPLVGDIINGIFVLGDQPYEIGDMIELVDTGQMGFVDDVTIRYTKIFTLQNTFLVIPNSQIRKRDVNNYSAEDIRTRQKIDVVITYESDVDEARQLMVEAASETPEIIGTKGSIRIGSAEYSMEPLTHLLEFGDHGILLRLRYWLREPFHVQRIQSKVNEKI
ncbi:MAG: mechanosensitive ion channel, partial [Halobacteria archaeon]|nr:mechanosensitive ion channel [Halobacteria archaeon]